MSDSPHSSQKSPTAANTCTNAASQPLPSVSGNKVTFRIILTSERAQPFRVVTIAEEAPFTAVLRFAAEEFGVQSVDSMAATTKDGTGINPSQSSGSVFMKYGQEVRLIPRDKVGSLQLTH